MKETPLKDLCYLGGWKEPQTILKCYQRPDEATMREGLALYQPGQRAFARVRRADNPIGACCAFLPFAADRGTNPTATLHPSAAPIRYSIARECPW